MKGTVMCACPFGIKAVPVTAEVKVQTELK